MVELMITLTVLAVLLVAGSSALGLFRSDETAELRKATETLVGVVEFAQADAMATNNARSLHFGTGTSPQTLKVMKHTTPYCFQDPPASTEPGAVYAKEIDFTAVGPGDTRARFSTVSMVAVIPNSVDALCFHPDGRVTDKDTGQPIAQPDSSLDLAAGEAKVQFRLVAQLSVPTAVTHEVVIPYNGKPKVNYVLP